MPSRSWGSVRVFSPPFSRARLIALLRERLTVLQTHLPLRRAVLFGSYARGTHTAFSDVDLLVVYADPPRADAFALVKRTLGVRGIEAHVFAEGEYNGVRATWERMTHDAVELWDAPGAIGEGPTAGQ